MSNLVEQPFDEREARYFLAEILKDSLIAPFDLINIIKQVGIQPRWTEIALPNGRSVSACQKAFEHLLSHPSAGFPISFRPPANPEPKAISSKSKKRSYPGGDAMTVDRIIQPRISDFSSVNDPFSPQYLPAPVNPNEPQRKKRGRPSKADYQVRLAEYAARGEVYPAPRKSKAPRQSAEGFAPTALMMTPATKEAGEAGPALTSTTTEAGITGIGSPVKQRSRPSTAEKPSENTAFENPSQSADQARPLPEGSSQNFTERPAEGTVSENQPSVELGSHGLIMAQMQERAARTHTDPRDDSLDLQQKAAQEQRVADERAWEAYQPSNAT